jgi:hypothetical protein
MHRPSRVLVAVCLCLAFGLATGEARAQEVRNVSWPSLDSQLAADRVVPGSSLQRLIEANQDFQLLRPEEANDKIPVPLWLRVLWRKKHPHGEYLASDPIGGYPHLLKEIHEWMTSHQDLLPGYPDEDVPPPSAARVGVGVSERRISSFNESRSESDIRVNFWDSSKVIAGSNNIQGSGRQAQYYSTDGGQTWGETTLPLVSQDVFHSDPTVDWTSDGMAWSTTIGITEDGEDLRLRLYRSADNGATWVFDSTISGSQTSADKQMAWIDHSPTSPHTDNMYVIWHDGRPVYMNRKTRNGAWGTPIKVSGSETTGTGIGADVKTNSAGVVFGFWPDTGSRKIYMVRSTNGGVSYSRPKAIAATADSYDIGVPAMNGRRVLLYVSAGAYKSASRDMVYAVWSDLTGATGCRAESNEPGNNANSACKTRIWFTRSADGGNTWSAKRMINNQAGKNDQLNPALAVDEATGRVAVIYYDTVGETRKKTNVWYQSSSDFGATWSAPFRVTAAATDETTSSADTGNQYGDYNGLSGYAGTFFPVWTDRRGNGAEQIWTAALEDQAGGCVTPNAPSGLRAAAVGNNRIDLAWNAVAAAQEYRIYRAATSGGPYSRVATVSASGAVYSDTGLTGGKVYYYVVRAAVAGCESGNSNKASATAQGGGGGGTCTTRSLYSEGFESASGLAGWGRGVFETGSNALDWRGVAACTARGGSKVFRFGGSGCTSDYGNNRFAFVQPGGTAGIAVPAGATQVRLSFWHRFDFEEDADGGLIAVSIDGQSYTFAANAVLSGSRYNGVIDSSCAPDDTEGLPIFTGEQRSYVNTVVDLDALCNAITNGGGGCAGRSVRIGFTAISDCLLTDDGWSLDDVQVTACVP